ncbi:predicted protein [Naegleria gruberi]|uniref:Predicted protein n=1 Tax=Naegleria gruberi TaxID=5762 RepID=D2VKA2_NAEGR|nr:uncharacterized protein NAEGRDRAFT_69322 [Naegleria gruberi]EFC42825.1 predicted protein [Naegleria gruberi]|eukprot:XP_002675569.1 predicted protein [Naegleria gruberi strain NEG-M]
MTSNGFENGTNNFPTVKNSVPFYLDPQASSSLGTICPHLVGQKVCCNSTQVSTMVSRFTLLDATFWRCIACVLNLKKMWCDFTCSNQQGHFLTIESMYETPKYAQYIKEVNFYVSLDFQNQIWESCKDVKLGQLPVKDTYANVRAYLQGMVNLAVPNPNIQYIFQTSESHLEKLTITKNITKTPLRYDQSPNYEDISVPSVEHYKTRKIQDFNNSTTQFYNGTMLACELSCDCTYCEKACGTITPDYSCKIFGSPCFVVASIGGSVILGLFIIAIISALFERGFNWFRNRNNKTNENIEVNQENSLNSDRRYRTF